MDDEAEKKKVPEITPVQQMISSCFGSVFTSLFVTPLDVVKVRQQTQQKIASSSNKCYLYLNGYIEELCCDLHAGKDVKIGEAWPRRKLTGTFTSFVKISRAEGITSLWSGLPTTLVMAVPATVIYFTLYDQLRFALTRMSDVRVPPVWVPIVAGSTARFVCVTVISPLEMIRTKMQSKRLSYKETAAAVRNLVRNNGLQSLWHGVGPTYWRDIPFSVIYWTNYEMFKKYFQQEVPSWWFAAAAGATSGTIAALATLPFDVVKTHLQVELGEMDSVSRKSTTVMLKQLYKKSGYKALFVGIVPRVVKVAPSCAIMISTYEYGKQYFRNYNRTKWLSAE